MADKVEWVRRHADHLRRLLMREPRGHADMCGARADRAGRARIARRRDLHERERLPGIVRPRHHRAHDDCARTRPPDAWRRWHDDRVRHGGRDRAGARGRHAAARRSRHGGQRPVVRCAGQPGRESRRAARCAPTWRSEAGSTRSSTARRSGCRWMRRACPSCGARAWRFPQLSTRCRPGYIRSPGLEEGIAGTIFTAPPRSEGADLRSVTVFRRWPGRPVAGWNWRQPP